MIKKIGIIGLGSIGLRHMRLVQELWPNINIVSVRSSKEGKSEQEKLSDSIVYSLEEAVYSGIQAAIIATPANYHIEQASYLMKKGVHVLIEKPLSNFLENVKGLSKISEQNKVIGLVGYCLRYSSGALKFIDLLKDRKTGQVLHVKVDCGSYLPNWRKKKDYRESVSSKKILGGGVLLELSHELDYIRWFFGEMKSVYASIYNSGALDIEVEDSADIIFEAKNGFPISVHLDFNSRNTRRKCVATCVNGDLIWDAVENKVTWLNADGFEKSEEFESNPDYIYKQQLKHFFDCIQNKTLPIVSIRDGEIVLEMIKSIRESSQNGRKVFFV